MTPAKGTGSDSDSNRRESDQKEWRRPRLRKLPIAATAAGHNRGDEGNTSKNGMANVLS
jgi:hypothetical protein